MCLLMARLPRYFVQGVPLHIILRGNNREPIFGNDEDCEFFKESLLDAAGRHRLAIHAYVFMTNHIHLLASPDSGESAPKTSASAGLRIVNSSRHQWIRNCLMRSTTPQTRAGGQGHFQEKIARLAERRAMSLPKGRKKRTEAG